MSSTQQLDLDLHPGLCSRWHKGALGNLADESDSSARKLPLPAVPGNTQLLIVPSGCFILWGTLNILMHGSVSQKRWHISLVGFALSPCCHLMDYKVAQKHDSIQPKPWCLKEKYDPEWSCGAFPGHLATVLCRVDTPSWWNHNRKHIWVTSYSQNCWLVWRRDGLRLFWCPPRKSDIWNSGRVALVCQYSEQLISSEALRLSRFHLQPCMRRESLPTRSGWARVNI